MEGLERILAYARAFDDKRLSCPADLLQEVADVFEERFSRQRCAKVKRIFPIETCFKRNAGWGRIFPGFEELKSCVTWNLMSPVRKKASKPINNDALLTNDY